MQSLICASFSAAIKGPLSRFYTQSILEFNTKLCWKVKSNHDLLATCKVLLQFPSNNYLDYYIQVEVVWWSLYEREKNDFYGKHPVELM